MRSSARCSTAATLRRRDAASDLQPLKREISESSDASFTASGERDGHVQHSERDALADALARHEDRLRAHELGQRLNRDCAADDGIGALGAQAGNFIASLFADRGEPIDDIREAIDGELVSVEARNGVFTRLTIDLGQVAHGPTGANEAGTSM